MRGPGLNDGLGGAQLPAEDRRIRFQTCNNESTSWKIETETLRPLPDETVAQEGLVWKTDVNRGITITGHVHGGWRYNLQQMAGTVILNLAFAFLGALYGAGLEQKQPTDTTFDYKQTRREDQRRPTDRKYDKSGRRRDKPSRRRQ